MGSGISQRVHDEELDALKAAKDAQISNLESKLAKAEKQMQAKSNTAEAQLTEAHEALQQTQQESQELAEQLGLTAQELEKERNQMSDTDRELEEFKQNHKDEVKKMNADQAELQQMLDLSAKAISDLNSQVVEGVQAKEEVIQDLVQEHAKTRQEVEVLRKEEMEKKEMEAILSVAAALNLDDNPESMKSAITKVQDTVTEMKVLREQIDRAQRKVAEYWQKIQGHEQLILNQKKQILTVENKNEKLLMQDPNMRLLKRRNQTSKSPTRLHTREMVL